MGVSVVDCAWSLHWSNCSGSCGVGTRFRTTVSRRHQGKECIGSSEEDCDTEKPPCKRIKAFSLTYLICSFQGAPSSAVIVEEGRKATLQCDASQYSGLSKAITFEWFRNGTIIPHPSHSNFNVSKKQYSGLLYFQPVKKSDTISFYTCKARGEHGLSASSAAITLDVTCKSVLILV